MIITQSIQKGIIKAINQAAKYTSRPAFAFTSSEDNKDNNNNNNQNQAQKQDLYLHKINYNKEQFQGYTEKVQSALKDFEDQQTKLQTASAFDLLPRRKRRIYDRPLHDTDITNYDAWRTYDKQVLKLHKHAARVVCKINISPKLLRHAFGEGHEPSRNEGVSTKEYDFEDGNMDSFLIYDYKATTRYHGDNIEGYDYQNQDSIPQKKRKSPHPTEQQFWEQEEPHQFRLNCTPYADHHKFKKWIETEVEKRSKNKSYEETIIERFGPFEIYDNFESKYQTEKDPSVFKFGREFYLEKGKKFNEKEIQANPYIKPIKPAKQMEEKYRVAWPYQWNPKTPS